MLGVRASKLVFDFDMTEWSLDCRNGQMLRHPSALNSETRSSTNEPHPTRDQMNTFSMLGTLTGENWSMARACNAQTDWSTLLLHDLMTQNVQILSIEMLLSWMHGGRDSLNRG